MQIRRFITKIENAETIAKGRGIRDLARLRSEYGGQSRNWRKLKGTADVELMNGRLVYAEVHWYECHGVGKVDEKVKTVLKILED